MLFIELEMCLQGVGGLDTMLQLLTNQVVEVKMKV